MRTDEIILYQTQEGDIRLEVLLDEETVWLSQSQMTMLFNTTKQNISLHLRNVFKEKELLEDSVVKDYLTTASDGKNYRTKYYNLDVIISVGYRVKSLRGTQFRIWANKVLKDYIVKGYSIQRPISKQEFDNAIAELEHQIANSEKFTEEQVSEVYKTLADFFSRKQIDEKPRKPVGFLIPKPKT